MNHLRLCVSERGSEGAGGRRHDASGEEGKNRGDSSRFPKTYSSTRSGKNHRFHFTNVTEEEEHMEKRGDLVRGGGLGIST